jgi:16S rRNA (adenine1518-N6/adenine1519-N6)-dimethyltransferase
MKEFHHKKSLGQHFLNDMNIVRKIADIASIEPGEQVWEVGPGKGILTGELLNRKAALTCFEIDKALYSHLESSFRDRINLVKQDVLKAEWDQLFPSEKVKIVANLPYQITSPFLFKTADHAEHISSIVIMIQKEVAQRITAQPSTKEYGILSVKMNYLFRVRYEFTVKPHLFFPPPKVESAVISLIPRENKPEIGDRKFFWKLINCAFRNRRKMLRRNLLELVSKEKLQNKMESSPIELTRRGETLTETEFVELNNWLLTFIKPVK